MKIKLIFILSCFVISSSIFSQNQEENTVESPVNTEQAKENSAKSSKNDDPPSIKNTEILADKIIFELNGELKKYSSLLKTDIDILPYRVIFYKGRSSNGKCVLVKDQSQPNVNCLRIETYDFTFNTSKASSFKSAVKFMELYFNQETLRNNSENSLDLTKVVTNAYIIDFSKNSTFLSEIVDNDPNSTPKHDNKIFLYNQKDGFPEDKSKNKGNSRLGLISLSDIKNRKLSPIRLNIKWDFYRKNLMYFERILAKIQSYNLYNVDKTYIKSLKNLQNSLDF